MGFEIIQQEVSCEGCGKCCTYMGYPSFMGAFSFNDDRWSVLPPEMQEEIRQAVSAGRGDDALPCIWFDQQTKKCKHYDLRPEICEEFEVGGEDCLRVRSGGNNGC